MDMLKLEKNRGYLISGIGGIVGFIAFFLPYVTVSAFVFSQSFSGAGVGGWVWLEALVALVAIAIPALLIYRSNPFGIATTPVEKQIRWGIYALIGAGALGILLHIIFAINASNVGYNGISLSSLVSVSLSIGYWLYLLAALAMLGGGIFAMRTAMPAASAMQSRAQQYPPQSQQYSPYQQQQWEQPQPPPQYPQPQYPPAQEQPPQQWPPS